MNKALLRILLVLGMVCASAATLVGQQYVISTVAGGVVPATPGAALNTSVGQPLFADVYKRQALGSGGTTRPVTPSFTRMSTPPESAHVMTAFFEW